MILPPKVIPLIVWEFEPIQLLKGWLKWPRKDTDWKERTRDEQQDMEREMPLATGVIDAVSVIKKLDEMGFNGPVTVEPFEPAATRLQAMPLDDACKEVVDSLNKVFNLAQIQ